MILSVYKNECILFVEIKNLKAQNTFLNNQFYYFYPFMVNSWNVRMYLGNV